ncbi:Yip1 family protein [Pelosinus sp. UFO1]|uniref:Yip1 family protein n=1 Tax=Pelosinus sp. UFO1 TaxID=484770 RepID=UPI0004D16F5C|nr:Yip1 family protein [Pelosinus sp. UFO1]AIF52903.1 Yip1 domain-containing protein [Pelosinus sp. UFO1]
MFRPRLTIRELLERETDKSVWNLWVSFTILLAVVAPMIGYLQAAIWGEPNLKLKEWLFGTAALVIINLLMFYFGSYFFWKTSLWLGGQCEKSQMRIVFAWTTIIPCVFFGSIDAIFTLLLGKENMVVFLANNVGVIWGSVVTIAGIRETTNLSIWRAGVVWMSPYVIVIGGVLIIITTLGLLIWSLGKIL